MLFIYADLFLVIASQITLISVGIIYWNYSVSIHRVDRWIHSYICKAIDTELEVPFCFDVLAYHFNMLFNLWFCSWPRQHKKWLSLDIMSVSWAQYNSSSGTKERIQLKCANLWERTWNISRDYRAIMQNLWGPATSLNIGPCIF